jgi:hypothetical protein
MTAPTRSSTRATDGSLTSDSAEVTLTVTASNDSPTVRVAAGGTCGKDDHSGTVNLTVADVESPAAELTLSAASLTGSSGGSGTDTATDFTGVDGDTALDALP